MKVVKINQMPLLAETALRGRLLPLLAADAKLDLKPILKGVSLKTWGEDRKRVKLALDAALAAPNVLVKDADTSDVEEVLEQLSDVAPQIADLVAVQSDDPDPNADPVPGGNKTTPSSDDDGDMVGRVMEFLKGKLSDEDLANLKTMMKPEVDPATPPAAPKVPGAKDDAIPPKGEKTETPEDKEAMKKMVTKPAMDAAIADAVKKTAESVRKDTIAALRSIATAEAEVAPHIGAVVAMDSAEAVYKMALDAAKIDLTDVPPSAYRAMVRMLPKPGDATRPVAAKSMAMDKAAEDEFAKMYPTASLIKLR